MKMPREDGLGPIAKTGFGKSRDLSVRQTAAKGWIGVLETPLEVFDQSRPQGQMGQHNFSIAVFAEPAEGQVAYVLCVDLVAMAEQMPPGIQVPGAGGTPGEGFGMAFGQEELAIALEIADRTAGFLAPAPGQEMPVQFIFVSGQGHPEIKDIP